MAKALGYAADHSSAASIPMIKREEPKKGEAGNDVRFRYVIRPR